MIVACWLAGCGGASENEPVVRISAAASIAYVIEGLANDIHNDLGVRIEVNSGASGALAQQITQGDQADLFISANPAWMDDVAGRGLIDTATRIDLVSNRLVLIGLPGSVTPPTTLAELTKPAYQPIALGDPAYVPAGRYAVQALEAHGLERGPDLKLAEAPNVRAVLAFVQSGQCPVGLVYASDVTGSEGVAVLLVIDAGDHDPIRYPAALLRDAPQREQAQRALDWLRGDRARLAFQDAGFGEP
jgi:molybdate transport system substrate-binding protein